MSLPKSFIVGSLSVNAAMATALEQDEVLSLISSEVIHRASVAARNDIAFGEQVMVSMFLSMPSQAKQRVASILLGRCFVTGTERKISVAEFQGKMVDYNTLLAQLTLWNFEDFFTYLSDAVKNAAPSPDVTAP